MNPVPRPGAPLRPPTTPQMPKMQEATPKPKPNNPWRDHCTRLLGKEVTVHHGPGLETRGRLVCWDLSSKGIAIKVPREEGGEDLVILAGYHSVVYKIPAKE